MVCLKHTVFEIVFILDVGKVIDYKCLMAEEFMHGVGPMLSVRGESILSWIGGGDFVVEDAATSTHESLIINWCGHFLFPKLSLDQMSRVICMEISMENPIKAQFNVRALLSLRAGCPRLKPKLLSLKLDMLLGSLSETKLPDSSGFGKSSYTAATPDNILDDLLEETSNLKEKEAATPLPLLARNAVASAKNTSTAATLDDVLDDLLEETSNLSNQNNLHQPLEIKGASYQILSSSSPSVTKSKVLDDFDLSSDTI
ncbi:PHOSPHORELAY PROTEIN [Salix purpurea]|uniref:PHOSPHORELAY PROTEIN n=1 Tax=Salix purpurea TaxID=77065 RepID=A0A9Q0ZNU2_SALPP|nr:PHOSPHORELAY PROTEIN [Salix purpurea]